MLALKHPASALRSDELKGSISSVSPAQGRARAKDFCERSYHAISAPPTSAAQKCAIGLSCPKWTKASANAEGYAYCRASRVGKLGNNGILGVSTTLILIGSLRDKKETCRIYVSVESGNLQCLCDRVTYG